VRFQAIIEFWFSDIVHSKWWPKDRAFDELITDRYSDIHRQACRCELSHWRKESLGRLAEILVIDQFSRNIYRNSPAAFAHDSLSLALSQEAINQGIDADMRSDQKVFLYMPYMHSESLAIHDMAIKLFAAPGLESSLAYKRQHRDIIVKFGRYPHRNRILNRQSTDSEREFLSQPGSSF
jgi:uncharacterized protein (DUF924 family)